MSRAENKTQRLLKIEELLLANPEGLSQAEIARRLDVHRSVIHRNLDDFEKIYPTVVHEDGRISLDRSAYRLRLEISLDEAMALHLAVRLLATRMDKHNPHAATALRKLGDALERVAPRISRHIKKSADAMGEADRRQDPNFLRTLEVLTRAWAEERMVRVWHRKESGQVTEYLFSPYFIEPYAVGQAVHVIGYRDPPGALRTFKVERIERIELTPQKYVIPQDFDPAELFRYAWGIWFTEEEPVKVTLKFSPNVVPRVLETRWHRTEQVEHLADGSLLWHALIADPQEMMPWIRGWGASCEVLQPEGLRQALIQEVCKMTRVYGIE